MRAFVIDRYGGNDRVGPANIPEPALGILRVVANRVLPVRCEFETDRAVGKVAVRVR